MAVYVEWYGQVLQGEVVENDCTGRLSDMVAVRIPLMGCHPVALFTQQSVYDSPEQAKGKSSAKLPEAVRQSGDGAKSQTVTPPIAPAGTPAADDRPVSEAWKRLQQFKASHWDHERNHLLVDALEEFYAIWRASVAARYGITVGEPASAQSVAVGPGSSEGEHSSAVIVDTQTGEILPGQPRPAPMPRPSKDIPRPTKKQLRSTGRIQYGDSIQTSLFDQI